MAEHRFRAMASDVHIVLAQPVDGAIAWCEQRVRSLEQCWSRFIRSSEVSQLNALGSGTLRVGADTLTLINYMQLAAVATAGAYDPTMLFEICDAGYSASHEDSTRRSVFADLPAIGLSVHDLVLNLDEGTVRKPAGLGLDPGGIGKGLAADLIVTQLLNGGGAAGALVSIGGDLAIGGSPANADPGWQVSIDDPLGRFDEVLRIRLNGGGVATSSTQSRRWRHHGQERHHVLDPRGRAQSVTDLATLTVVASSGWLAEAHATAGMLEGSNGVIDYLEHRGLTGTAVTNHGRLLMTTDLARLPPWTGAKL